jgi:GTP pyrophosphokinase
MEPAMDENLEDRPILTTRLSRRTTNDAGVIVNGDKSLWVKLARCCTPLPGDEILGFITRENGVSVHRVDCTNAKALLAQPERLVQVEWAPTTASGYDVTVQIEGLDQTGMLSDVTKVLADLKVNITAAHVTTNKDRIVKMRLTLEAADPKHLQHVIASIKKVPGVYDTFRVKQ